jgi:3-oxoadipate enol-lactonase/4-carboxymuconolactone decarboxylase
MSEGPLFERTVLNHVIDGPMTSRHRPLILGPSIGTSLRVWAPLADKLAADGRTVIRYDLPGHGGTPAGILADTAPGRASVADLARLVLALADRYGIATFDYAGISLGGAVGSWLALHHGSRVAHLAVVCSSARFGEPGGWHDRAALVRGQGTGPLLDVSAARWFTEPFRTRGAPLVADLVDDLRTAEPAGYAACCDALAGFDLRDDLPKIGVPTLVIAGREDPATPPAHSRLLADGIPDAALLEIPHAAHLAPAEQPARVAAALLAHLAAPDDAGGSASGRDDARAAGMKVRRAVLGDEHVDRAVAHTTPFTADFQDFIARYAWGEIWTRPGLDRRTRSVITLTALIAHGHHAELAMHLRGALNNGLTRNEIKEVLLQSAVYCGVPAANSAFAVAQRVLAELDQAELDQAEGSSCAPQ